MTDTATPADETSQEHLSHPLDPATGAEYLAGRDFMAAAGLLPEGDRAPVRFAYYGLILDSDFAAVDEITKADPDWRAAMARRGYHDLGQIRTCPITAGNYGPPGDDRRESIKGW